MQYLSHLFNQKCKNANIKPPSNSTGELNVLDKDKSTGPQIIAEC